MTELDADTLLPNARAKEMVLAGEMSQIHRGNPYADVGDTFAIDGISYRVTTVEQRTLGDLTDADARAEGSDDLDAYRERLVHAHGGNFEWNDDAEVHRHAFERIGDVSDDGE